MWRRRRGRGEEEEGREARRTREEKERGEKSHHHRRMKAREEINGKNEPKKATRTKDPSLFDQSRCGLKRNHEKLQNVTLAAMKILSVCTAVVLVGYKCI